MLRILSQADNPEEINGMSELRVQNLLEMQNTPLDVEDVYRRYAFISGEDDHR